MWIITIGLLIFIGIIIICDWRSSAKKDREKAVIEECERTRKKKIAESPNVTIIAEKIVSQYDFPQKIKVHHNCVYINDERGLADIINYEMLGIANIREEDCYTLAAALCAHATLQGKYTHIWRTATSEWDEENWLELKKMSSSLDLKEW